MVDAGDAKTPDALRDIRKGHEAKIAYVEKDGVKTATKIWFKGPIKIAPEKLVKYDDVAALVAKGPAAGDYVLVDSRPLPRVQEGTIPTLDQHARSPPRASTRWPRRSCRPTSRSWSSSSARASPAC